MNVPFVAACSTSARTLALLLLGLLALPLTGCNAPHTTYNLSTVAMNTVDAQTQAALKTELAVLTPGDHTQANLQHAAELLAKANADAPTSAQARAAQALIIATLPENAYRTSQYSPELHRQLGIAFDQADQRMKDSQGAPDLMTVMVWASTGVTLERKDQLCATVQRAAGDPQLTSMLREDDYTREQLWSHLSSNLDDSHDAILYRKRDITASDVGNTMLGVVALPLIIIMLVLYGGDWCC